MGKRILLVDDHTELRETVRRLLSEDQHTVVEANNGAEALGLFKCDRFDLVMTDYKMPFLMGNELAARIKQMAPGQPILMITGYGQKLGPHNPVNAILYKPFGASGLREAIATVLAG
jgi:CheY-like chemotaxis protein